MKKIILICTVIVLVLSGCISHPNNQTVVSNIQQEITAPSGFTLIDIDGYGAYVEGLILVCKENSTGNIYFCTDGKVGEQIIVPEGYEFFGISAYGAYVPGISGYCRQKNTDKIFKCK